MASVQESLQAVMERKSHLQHRLDEHNQFGLDEVKLLVLGLGSDVEDLMRAAGTYAQIVVNSVDEDDDPESVFVSCFVDGFIAGAIFADKRREEDAAQN